MIKGHAEIDVSAIPDRKGGKQALDASLNVPPPPLPYWPLAGPLRASLCDRLSLPQPPLCPSPSHLPPSPFSRARTLCLILDLVRWGSAAGLERGAREIPRQDQAPGAHDALKP